MSTTIDSLQIEIKSSSTNAASGIDSLAASLEKLKKNGSFKTVSTNLKHLSDSLNGLPNVHSASNSLRTLANSIEKLKGVGSISTISNSLKKLPDALKSLSGIDLGKTKTQLEGVADAVSPLSSIKAGGLSTMVNAMKNLGKVTESLDDETIEKFTQKVELLTKKLGPLSEKMTSISAGFKAINSNAKSATRTVDNFSDEVDSSALNLSSYATVIDSVVNVLQNLIAKMSEYIHVASQWDGIEYQFGNAFGEQADLYYEKITKITDALDINKQIFMENSAMAASMLIGFEVDKNDAREMGLGYTELAYDIWAAFNNVYETLDGADGAMAAVRSAIAGEVEPIRRAGFTIVDSQLAITAANHGLEYSSYSATEAQKSYLRYLTLVDQAMNKGIIGTYASEMQTAEGMMRTFSQQLKTLAQTFGSLFLPILVKVMPYFQAFVELLTEGVYWLANFFGIDIQPVDFSDYKTGASTIDDVASSVGGVTDALDTATESAKALKNATLGIDELNVISPTSGSAGGGAGAGGTGSGSGGGFEGLDVSSLWDESILDGIKSDVDEVKEKMRGWMPVIASVAGALAGLRLAGLIKDMQLIAKAGAVFAGVAKAFGFVKDYIKAVIAMAPEVGWLAAMFPKLSGFIAGIGPAFTKAATAVGGFLAGITGPVWIAIASIIAAIASVAYFLYENWGKVVDVFKRFFNENIAPKLEEIKGHFDNMKVSLEPLVPLFDWLVDAFKFVVHWGGKIIEVIGGALFTNLTMMFAGFFNSTAGAIENVIQVFSGAIQIFAGGYELIVALFTGGDIEAAWQKIWNGVVDYFKGMWGLVLDLLVDYVSGVVNWILVMWEGFFGKSVVTDKAGAFVEWFSSLPDLVLGFVVDCVEGVIDWFFYLWDELVGHSIVPDIVNGIVKWFTSLPGKIFKSVENFATGIVDKFKGMWSKLVSWWNGKTKLKEYTPSIGSIYDKVKSRWDSARTWWNSKKSAMKTYTPSIGSIYEKVYDRWKNARDWWNKKKGSFKTYTPSIGSLTDKLRSAWNSAKSWWNKNVKLSTKLNVQVPTIKVKWDTASAFGKSFKYPTGFSLKFAANGGIFDQGSLVWAGERGPEVVAKAAGGKTGVMNVQQMQDAVYEGVYSAVVAAMRGQGGGGSQDVHVYLDGREINASIKKHQRESGATLMGNEVYAY